MGVDVSTVSRVLNNDPHLNVRSETRQRVVDAATRLDYKPHAGARALKTARTMALGLVIPNLSNVAYAEVAEGARERADEAGYVLLVAPGTASERIAALRGRIDGILLATSQTDLPIAEDLGRALPSLLINRRAPGHLKSVTIDDAAGIETLVEHLLRLGHREIAHVAGPPNTDTGIRRLEAFRKSLRSAGLPVRRGWTPSAEYSERGGYAGVQEILRGPRLPTAIVTSTVAPAIGAMVALRDAGIAVPGQISVVAYDDVPLASYLTPRLTAVEMPLRDMGRAAVEMLLRLIAGDDVQDQVVATRPILHVRESSAPPSS